METQEAIRGRKSIRAFLPKPVPKDLVEQVLDVARWAPSGSNRQPWRVTVATGEACARLSAQLAAMAEIAIAERSAVTTDPARSRPSEVGAQILAASRLPSRRNIVVESNRLWGAPVVIVVSHTGDQSSVHNLVTTLLLAAHDLGLGTCWLGYPLANRDVIREHLAIPEDEKLGAVVALGYPDLDAPVNGFRSSRMALDDFVRWVGYD